MLQTRSDLGHARFIEKVLELDVVTNALIQGSTDALT